MHPLKHLLARLRRNGIGKVRTRKGVAYADPLHAGRHPFQTYMLFVCVLAGVPLVFSGGAATPNSIEATLPDWLAFLWGLSLLVGAALALTGSYWPGDYSNALTLERIGLAISGGAAIIYGLALLTTLGWTGLVPGALTLGFGAACITRARDIGRIIQNAIHDLRVNG